MWRICDNNLVLVAAVLHGRAVSAGVRGLPGWLGRRGLLQRPRRGHQQGHLPHRLRCKYSTVQYSTVQYSTVQYSTDINKVIYPTDSDVSGG